MAEVIRYVDPDASGAANGTSWTDAYTSLSAWEVAEAADLVTAGDWHHVYCRSSSGTADTTTLQILGWTLGANNYILIEAASTDKASASGWDTAKYRLSVTDQHVIDIREDYVRFKDLQLEFVYSAGNDKKVISWGVAPSVGANYFRVDSCYIRKSGAGGASHDGIYSNQNNVVVDIFNCIVTGFTRNGIGSMGKTTHVYNCTVYNCLNGFYDWLTAGETFTMENCIAFSCTTDFDVNNSGNGTVTVDYCASDDNYGTNNVAESGGGAAWPDDFEGAATGDFRLKSGSNLVGATSDLSGGLFTDDIEGTVRGAAWDIGAFEYVAADGGIVVLRRRRM